MKQKITFCTAGHIDHGKSSLVIALTGEDPDTRPEEKMRGMTIDLGFTFMPVNDEEIAIIDVPGHEDFVKTMIAGSWGVDYFLLTIASDEGVMPQTIEHAEIIASIGLKEGVIAMTRVDLANDKMRLSSREEARTLAEEMGFTDTNIIETSAVTGVGINELRDELARLTRKGGREREIREPFFLPIDRILSIPGHGTVVAGTVACGTYRLGKPLRLLPHDMEVRVRSVQTHGQSVDEVYPGQRSAFNLPRVEAEMLERGNCLVDGDIYRTSSIITVTYNHSKRAEKPLLHRQRVRLLTGTTEVIGRMSILDRDTLMPGDNTICQFMSEKPLVTRYGDPFIICHFSTKRVIGGGRVLDPHSKRVRRKKELVERYRQIEKDGERGLIELIMKEMPADRLLWTEEEIARRASFSEEKTRRHIETLKGDLNRIGDGYITTELLSYLGERVRGALERYHRENPTAKGMEVGSLFKKLGYSISDGATMSGIIEMIEGVQIEGKIVYLSESEVALSRSQRHLVERIIKELEPEGDEIKILGESGLREIVGSPDERNFEAVMTYLTRQGDVFRLFGNKVIGKKTLNNAIKFLKDVLSERGSVRASEFKDIAGISRRDATAILDHLNNLGYTRRVSGTHYPPDNENRD